LKKKVVARNYVGVWCYVLAVPRRVRETDLFIEERLTRFDVLTSGLSHFLSKMKPPQTRLYIHDRRVAQEQASTPFISKGLAA